MKVTNGKTPNYDGLISLAKANNGIIRTQQAIEAGFSKPYLARAVQNDVIEKVAHGVYIGKHEYEDKLYVFQLKYSRLIFSCYTSAYLLELTTRDVESIYATAPRNYNTSKLLGKNIIVREAECYGLGATETTTMFGNKVKLHNAERTLCDFFNPKYAGDKFVQVEVLKNYLQSKEKNLTKLFDYAKQLGVLEELRKRVEVLL